jgi:hypothetical protein
MDRQIDSPAPMLNDLAGREAEQVEDDSRRTPALLPRDKSRSRPAPGGLSMLALSIETSGRDAGSGWGRLLPQYARSRERWGTGPRQGRRFKGWKLYRHTASEVEDMHFRGRRRRADRFCRSREDQVLRVDILPPREARNTRSAQADISMGALTTSQKRRMRRVFLRSSARAAPAFSSTLRLCIVGREHPSRFELSS